MKKLFVIVLLIALVGGVSASDEPRGIGTTGDEGEYYTFTNGTNITRFDSGNITWSISLSSLDQEGNVGPESTLELTDQYVYTTTSPQNETWDQIIALNRETGELEWEYNLRSRYISQDQAWPNNGSHIFLIANNDNYQNTSAIVLDADDGTVESRWALPQGEYVGNGVHPLYHDGSLYYMDYRGNLYAIDYRDQEVDWRQDLSWQEGHNIEINDDGSRIYVSTSDEIIAMNATDGTEEWRYTSSLSFENHKITWYEGSILTIGEGEETYLMSVDGGELEYQEPIENISDHMGLTPTSGGVLYISQNNTHTTINRASNGTISTEYELDITGDPQLVTLGAGYINTGIGDQMVSLSTNLTVAEETDNANTFWYEDTYEPQPVGSSQVETIGNLPTVIGSAYTVPYWIYGLISTILFLVLLYYYHERDVTYIEP